MARAVPVGLVVVVFEGAGAAARTFNALRAVGGVARGVRVVAERGAGGRAERLAEGVLRRARGRRRSGGH